MTNTPLSIIKTCRTCDSSDFTPLFSFRPIPLAGSFCDSYQEAVGQPKYPISFVVNNDSGLIQSMESIDPAALFLKYKYDSSTIPALVKHFEGLANQLKIRFIKNQSVKLLEIGSNSNPLLNQLPVTWDLTAVDPSDVAARAHRNRNIRLCNDFFCSDFVEKNGLIEKYDCITASNCLAHIPNLSDIFVGIRLALKPGGEFWIEVKDGETAFNHGEIFDNYLEHCVLWNINSLRFAMSKFGFQYKRHEVLPFHGGLLRAVFEKVSIDVKESLPEDYFKKVKAAGSKMQEFYDNLGEHPVTKVLKTSPNNIAFGASGKATMMLNMLAEHGVRFSYIVDESPTKIGKFIPGVGVPIVSPQMLKAEVEKRNILVCAWNYYDTIYGRYGKIGNYNWLKYF